MAVPASIDIKSRAIRTIYAVALDAGCELLSLDPPESGGNLILWMDRPLKSSLRKQFKADWRSLYSFEVERPHSGALDIFSDDKTAEIIAFPAK